MDPLVKIPIEQWPLLQDKLKAMWPLNIGGFYTLYLNIKYPNVRETFQFKVYSPYGDIENGFVATSDKLSEIIMFSISKDTSRLEEAILNTKRIDWTKYTCIDLVNSAILLFLRKNVLASLNLNNCYIGRVKTFFLDKKTKTNEIRYQLNTYLGPINQEQIRKIDDIWPYKYDESYFYFCTLAANDLAFGLYSADNELLAWVFINEHNFICHLYCEEQHRRKGYAECLLKYVVNDQLGRGNDVYTYVEDSNETSARLFGKLGFVNIDDGAYILTQKKIVGVSDGHTK